MAVDSRQYEIQVVEALKTIGRLLGGSSGSSSSSSSPTPLGNVIASINGIASRLESLQGTISHIEELVEYEPDAGGTGVGAWHFKTSLYADGFISAGGIGSGGGGGGGGLIEQVYRIGDFGGTFDSTRNDTFNAYAINDLHLRISALESAPGGGVTSVAGLTGAVSSSDLFTALGLGDAATKGVASSIGASVTSLVSGSLLYDVLGDAFDASNTVKDFVNSSIATATATFRGTNTTATTESAFLTWANGLTHDLNDYVFWATTDSSGNTVYKKYKYNGTSWAFEYELNNSSFTSAQWSAINSGITSSLVTAFGNKYDKPSGGIPKTDLASAVQTSLGLADTSIQSHQSIYALTIKNSAGTTEKTYTPNSAAESITLTKAMVGLGDVSNLAPSGYFTAMVMDSNDLSLTIGGTTKKLTVGYASKAATLNTARTIWGQSFDGSGNVTGDMSGVGSIAFSASGKNIGGLLYFDTTNSRIGIATSAPSYALDITGTIHASGAATLGSTLSVSGTSTLTGKVGIGGAPDSTNALKVSGVAYSTTGMYSDGYVTAGTAASSSDARLKDNIEDVLADRALCVLMQLRPREWEWNKNNHYLSGKRGAGFVAQEMDAVLPFAVLNEGKYLSLNYNILHAYEVAGLQNHEKRICELEKKMKEVA